MNLASVDLNLLVAFEALMEERHVTRAADRIGLAQPSMSNALKRLRVLFDDALFLRAGGAMQPTDKAVALARPIAVALREIRAALAPETGFDAATSRRHFTIAVTDYGDLIVVPSLIRLLRREAPGVDLSVRPITDGQAAVARLERGEVDALVGGHLPDSSQCVRHRLFDERFVCVTDAARQSDLAQMPLKDFAGLPHAMFSSAGGDSIPGVVDTLLARHGLKRRIAVTLAHVGAVPFAVAGTDLVATMAERIARLFVESTGTCIHAPPFDIPSFAVDLVQARRSIPEPGSRWFMTAIGRAVAV
jgi:DNA-binding transcriptional LysR family regulator